MSGTSYAGDLRPAEAWKLLDEDRDAVLVDVRTDAEWRFVGLPDLAGLGKEVLLAQWQFFPDGRPNPAFPQDAAEAGLAKGRPVLFLCRSGVRSRAAAIAMTQLGYGPCYNVAEGFEGDKDAEGHRGSVGGWKRAGLPWRQE